MEREITLTVNGDSHFLRIDPKETLAEVLRNRLDLTGTKEGCGQGECGACTVLLGGKAVASCLVLAVEADGGRVTTIEGLASPQGVLHPLQQAFVDYGAIQCGFCSPGMIMSAKALLDRTPDPSEEEIRSGLEGNLCRCTGYQKIVEAVQAAAAILRATPER